MSDSYNNNHLFMNKGFTNYLLDIEKIYTDLINNNKNNSEINKQFSKWQNNSIWDNRTDKKMKYEIQSVTLLTVYNN